MLMRMQVKADHLIILVIISILLIEVNGYKINPSHKRPLFKSKPSSVVSELKVSSTVSAFVSNFYSKCWHSLPLKFFMGSILIYVFLFYGLESHFLYPVSQFFSSRFWATSIISLEGDNAASFSHKKGTLSSHDREASIVPSTEHLIGELHPDRLQPIKPNFLEQSSHIQDIVEPTPSTESHPSQSTESEYKRRGLDLNHHGSRRNLNTPKVQAQASTGIQSEDGFLSGLYQIVCFPFSMLGVFFKFFFCRGYFECYPTLNRIFFKTIPTYLSYTSLEYYQKNSPVGEFIYLLLIPVRIWSICSCVNVYTLIPFLFLSYQIYIGNQYSTKLWFMSDVSFNPYHFHSLAIISTLLLSYKAIYPSILFLLSRSERNSFTGFFCTIKNMFLNVFIRPIEPPTNLSQWVYLEEFEKPQKIPPCLVSLLMSFLLCSYSSLPVYVNLYTLITFYVRMFRYSSFELVSFEIFY